MSYNINALRFCKDIGMWALDRGVQSCRFATEFCREHCYNKKLYRVYPAMFNRDEQNDRYWRKMWAEHIALDVAKAMQHKQGSANRFRFATRGEAVGTVSDLLRVCCIADASPDVTFWIPTRAWRSYDSTTGVFDKRNDLYGALMRAKMLPNLRLMASIDPTTTAEEFSMLECHGWSTIGFGMDKMERQVCCPKTYYGLKGHCAECKLCFGSEQVHVHLKEH